MARTASSVKDSQKKKRSSSTKSRQEELENKLDSLEKNFQGLEHNIGEKFDFLLEFLQKDKNQNTGGQATQRTDDNEQDNSQSVACKPSSKSSRNKDNDHSVERRPIISLEPNLDESLGSPRLVRHSMRDPDEVSLQLDHNEERDLLGLCSDNDSDYDEHASNITSPNSPHLRTVNEKSGKKSDKFGHYLPSQTCDTENIDNNNNTSNTVDKSSTKTLNVLSKIFGDNITDDNSERTGLLVDESQANILENSWRSKHPERLTAFKDEYRSCFPVNEQSMSLLQVPSLDDLLEPMLNKTHGAKAVRNWDKQKQLFTQPLKSIERLAFQGQIAARMGIISVLYTQQTLGTLYKNLENEKASNDSCQIVKDLFDMSQKSLDQLGRTGAFHHMIRRKCASSDSGLNNLKDIQAKTLYLPLTEDGVFGKGLEKQ